MTKRAGLNGPLFFLGYLPFMLATYVLPYGGSNSAVVQGLSAGTNAPQTGHFQMLFLMHLGSIAALCLLTWVRGNGADKGWIVIFPLLAGVFDLVPGLNWIPLVPTVMHLCALIAGSRARAILVEAPVAAAPISPGAREEMGSAPAPLPAGEPAPAELQPTPPSVAAPPAEPLPARSGLSAAMVYSGAVVLAGVGLVVVLGIQQYVDAQRAAEQKLLLARESMLREQEQSRLMLAAAEAQRADEVHERQRLEAELRQEREVAAAQESELQAQRAQQQAQAAVDRERQQEAMTQAAEQAQRAIAAASLTQLQVNNQNCADQDIYLNSQRLGTVARESVASFRFPAGQYDVRFCAVRSNNCGDARTVFFPAGGQVYTAYRHPSCR